MVVSTVQVRNMRYEVGRNRQAATGQLIINFVYFLINFVYLFVRRYFPDTPRQDAVNTTRRWLYDMFFLNCSRAARVTRFRVACSMKPRGGAFTPLTHLGPPSSIT